MRQWKNLSQLFTGKVICNSHGYLQYFDISNLNPAEHFLQEIKQAPMLFFMLNKTTAFVLTSVEYVMSDVAKGIDLSNVHLPHQKVVEHASVMHRSVRMNHPRRGEKCIVGPPPSAKRRRYAEAVLLY